MEVMEALGEKNMNFIREKVRQIWKLCTLQSKGSGLFSETISIIFGRSSE